MIPTAGLAWTRARTNAAASRICPISSLATSALLAAQDGIDAPIHLGPVQSFHLDHLGARRPAAHHRHLVAPHAEQAGEQLRHRAVRASALGRCRDRELERAVPE